MANDVRIDVRVRDQTGPGVQGVNRSIRDIRTNANQANGPLRQLSGQLDGVTGAAQNASSSLGGGMGMKGQLIAVGAVLGTSALPAIGALVPMLAGLGAAGGVVALAFGDIKKEAKTLKPAFKDLQDVASKAVMPGVKSAIKDVGVAMKELHPAVKVSGKAVGDFAKEAGKFAKSDAFQSAFLKNVQMGSKWMTGFGDSVLDLTQSLLDFGTKSQPTLDALGGGINDLVGSDLPDFFKALEPGIQGSADMFKGLFDMVGKLLPSLGRFSGALAKNLGPALGAILRYAGTLGSAFLDGLVPALDALGPTATSAGTTLDRLGEVVGPLARGIGTVLGGAVRVLAPVFKNLFDLMSIAVPIASDLAVAIAGPLLSAFTDVSGADKGMDQLGKGLKDFGNWVADNKGNIDQALRSVAVSILDMVIATVDAAPEIFNAFRTMVNGVLDVLGVMANGAAKALGWVPGLGGKLDDAAASFNGFRASVTGSLDNAGDKIQKFSDSALPKLKGQRMNLDVSPYNAALGAAGKALSRMPKPKTAKLTARDGVSAAVRMAQRAIDSLVGKTVFINYQGKSSGLIGGKLGKNAHGGIIGAYASGGTTSGSLSLVGEEGPEIVRLPVGSTVYPAGKTRQMMADGAEPVQAYAKGGTVTKAERAARAAARGDLTVSYFGQRAGRTNSEFANSLGSPSSLSELVSSLNRWRGIIKAATSGATERGLLKSLNSTAATLMKQERALAKVNSALDKAKDKLSGLKDAAASLAGSVRSGIISGGNITGAAGGDGQVTLGGVMASMTGNRDQATALASALKELKKRGLNAQSLSEIAQAGVAGGGLETATALLSGNKSDIKEINSLEKQLKAAATSAGKTTADAMYGAGIKAAEGLVKGLEKQQHRLEKLMEKVAKALEKAIERAFKHKATGGIIGAASGGARGGLTWVGEQGPELARLPYGSTVYPAGRSRQMAMAGGGGGQPLVINLSIGNRQFGQLWVDTGRHEVRANGGLTATLGGSL